MHHIILVFEQIIVHVDDVIHADRKNVKYCALYMKEMNGLKKFRPLYFSIG